MGNNLLKEWKHRLGLDDWVIKLVDKCSPQTMTLASCSGCTEWDEVNKAARIEIVDPMYYGERIKPFDYEKTLVHELLHIKTSFVSDGVDDLQGRIMHQMIDDLARALVDAKRYDPLNGRLSETDETDETDEAPHPSRCACHLPPRGKA